jgi:hypothetical protein
MLATVICLGMATRNFNSGIRQEFVWSKALPIQNEALKFFVLVWNESVNIHQFCLYGPLMLYQFWRGYQEAKAGNLKLHEVHMRSATLFLLGPLAQVLTAYVSHSESFLTVMHNARVTSDSRSTISLTAELSGEFCYRSRRTPFSWS